MASKKESDKKETEKSHVINLQELLLDFNTSDIKSIFSNIYDNRFPDSKSFDDSKKKVSPVKKNDLKFKSPIN